MSFRTGFPATLAWMLACFALTGGCRPVIGGDGSVLMQTQETLDLAINGPGYFELRDELGKTYFTRWGSFKIDQEGYVVAWNGYRLQGDSGDIRIFFDAKASHPGATLYRYDVNADGRIPGVWSDGMTSSMGQILLRTLASPEAGVKFCGGMILNRGNLGASAQQFVPGYDGVGSISTGVLEVPPPELIIHGKAGRIAGSGNSVLAGSYIDTDLAIYGRGYFVLRDPVSNERFATRAGAFYWDEEGYLVNYTGLRIQGFMNETSRIDDIRADWHNQIAWAESDIVFERSIDRFGKIRSILLDGTQYDVGQIFLSDSDVAPFQQKHPFALYEFDSSPGAWSELSAPDQNGLGMIFAGQQDIAEMDAAIVEARKKMNFFVRGVYVFTGRPSDLYVNGGQGFFTVRNPTNDTLFATRNGAFHLDDQAFLVTEDGFRVQGLINPTAPGAPFTEISGDIRLDVFDVSSGAKFDSFSIRENGRIRIMLSDGSQFDRAQIRLQNYRRPHALVRQDHYLYSNVESALPEFPVIGTEPGAGGTGTLISGAVEDIQFEPGIQIPSSDAMRLTWRNHPNGGIVEASSDFIHWTPLSWPGYSVLDATDFFDEPAPDNAPRFYRVKVPAFESLPLFLPPSTNSITIAPGVTIRPITRPLSIRRLLP